MVTYIKKVKLISRAANAVGKEKDIALHPANILGRIFKTNAGTRHAWYFTLSFSNEERD